MHEPRCPHSQKCSSTPVSISYSLPPPARSATHRRSNSRTPIPNLESREICRPYPAGVLYSHFCSLAGSEAEHNSNEVSSKGSWSGHQRETKGLFLYLGSFTPHSKAFRLKAPFYSRTLLLRAFRLKHIMSSHFLPLRGSHLHTGRIRQNQTNGHIWAPIYLLLTLTAP